MMIQVELPLTDPARTDARAERLTTFLQTHPHWYTRRQLLECLSFTPRDCRAARQAAKGKIIYGQKGFLATIHATMGEVKACINNLYSQSRELEGEARELSKIYHSKGGK